MQYVLEIIFKTNQKKKKMSWWIFFQVCTIIIHHKFSLVHDWSKWMKWLNIPQLKLGNVWPYPPLGGKELSSKVGQCPSDIPNFQNHAHCKRYLKDNEHTASIWWENVLGYLFLDFIFSLKLTVLLEVCSRKTVHFSEQKMPADN